MKITRRFTKTGQNVFDQFEYTLRTSTLRNTDGSTVFKMENIEVPSHWSQVATDILAQKYFRKAGVPQFDENGSAILDENGQQVLGAERSIRQVAHRLAGCWADWGKRYKYFDSDEDVQSFYDETVFMILKQMCVPNSPQWFNTGLNFAYGISGPSQGHHYVDPDTKKLVRSKDAYTHPQPHACFIQSVNDDLVNEGGIFDLVTREARIFKYGSGTGSNFSALRGETEPLSGGGVSSGLMSFLKVNDRAAGAVKSGGTTRRAAKMVILNVDHPDIEMFIDWKMLEEQKVAALVAGSKICNLFLNEIMNVASRQGLDYSQPDTPLHDLVQRALSRGVPMSYIVRVLDLVKQGKSEIDFPTYNTHYEGEAYLTVSGQNSNNSVRVSNEFMDAVFNDGHWELTRRTDGKVTKTLRARELWNKINYAAWSCADPGIQYHTTINEWHTCPKDGEILASNPCVTADTFVPTNNGMERIGDLIGQARAVKSADGEMHWVENIFPTGTKPVYELQTRSGYSLKLTGDHKVFTENRGDVPAHQLRKDDIVRLIPGEFGTESTGSTDIAQLIGLLTGDGYNASSSLTDANDEIGIVAWATDRINALRPEFEGDDDRSNVIGTPTVMQTAAGNSKTLGMIERFASLDQGSEHKKFTDAVFRLTKSEQAALLCGLFTADGTVANYGSKSQHVALDSSSLELIQQVQLLLLNFGIKSKIHRNRRAGNQTALLPDGQGGVKEYQVQEIHSLRISRSSRVLFAQEIGFMEQSRKADALADLNRTISAYCDMLIDPVASLEYLGEEPVFDLTEPETDHFVANGIAVHNCSEYMFLDDTACNLASINLGHFYDHEKKIFDVEGYKHTARIWTIVLEVSVLMAQFPSASIAQKSYDFRTLGLGYANLGTVLMTAGIPYDSERARAWTGAITAILTGEAYATSAEMARDLEPFPRYKANAKNMLRVIRNHRRAAHSVPASEYEGLTITPISINHELCPENLSESAKECWDRALALGEQYGYRNAQVSVVAPTGCLTGNALVSTDFGLVPLQTLGDINGAQWQDTSFRVMTDEGEQQATKFYINGVADTRRITTASGYEIQGTLQHRIKVVNPETKKWEWKRFADVSSRDILPLAMNTIFGNSRTVTLPMLGEFHWNSEYNTVTPETMNVELAELVGYFMGDGSLHAKGLRYCVSNEDRDVVERLAVLHKSLFNQNVAIEPRQGYIEVTVHSVALTHWWNACGFAKLKPTPEHSGKGYLPRIPNAVLYSNDPAIYGAFLRGLFEADGTVGQGVPSWTSSHKPFAMQVKQLMLALGIATSLKHDISGWGNAPLYVVRLLNQSYNHKFMTTIGFMGKRKSDAVKPGTTTQAGRHDYVYLEEDVLEKVLSVDEERNAVKLGLKRHGGVTRGCLERVYATTGDADVAEALNYYFDIVESNEDGGEQMTYDISVPENVTYIANGFISHNTIGLVMDCDTTGIEPDFAVVKFKKLSGGGYFKIVNQSVTKALRVLGYSDAEIIEIERYIKGHGTLAGCPGINRQSLKERNFTDEMLDAIEKQLDNVFDVRFAFNKWTLGEDFLMSLGFTDEQLNDPGFSLLEGLGYTDELIEKANQYVCGMMTIEGAPGLKAEHLPVFDCATTCGKHGKRYIDYMGHVKMMAAAQPFISGAISKTINMPNHASVAEVDRVYTESWKMMVKAIALYRDGSKLSQPLNSSADNDLTEEVTLGDLHGTEDNWDENIGAAQIHERIVEKVYHRAERRRLPKRRHGFVREATVGGHKVFIRTGEYEDGTIGEIFIDMYKEGASFKGLMNCFAVLASKALQYGMPLEKMVDTFTFTRFEPSGSVQGHEAIKSATSIIDYVFRAIGYEYLGREDFVHVKAVDEPHDNGNGKSKLSPGQDLYARQNGTKPVLAESTASHSVSSAKAESGNAKVRNAKAQGYTGDQCGNCGSMRVKQNGACHVCDDCGTTSGCS